MHHPIPPSGVWNGEPLAYRNATVRNNENMGVHGKKADQLGSVIRAPISSLTKHPLTETTLVGTISNVGILNDLPFYLKRWTGLKECVVRYLGGLTIILTFPSKRDALDYLENKGREWGAFFSSLAAWDGMQYPEERLAWITIRGIPPHLFGSTMIQKIADSCGKVVAEVDVSNLESNLAFTRVPILTRTMDKVKKKFIITHQGLEHGCWVYEDSDEWIPGYMIVGSPSFTGESDDRNSGCSSPSIQHIGEDSGRACEGSRPTLNNETTMHEEPRSLGRLGMMETNADMATTLNLQATSVAVDHPRELISNDDVLQNGPHVSTGPIGDELSQSSQVDGPENSDPFNLGPIIDEVMAHKNNNRAVDNLGEQGLKERGTRGSRHTRRNIRLFDLNKDIHDLYRFKLSRYLLSRRRRQSRKRGNSLGNIPDSEPQDVNSQGPSLNGEEAHSVTPRVGG
ncbi:hypothetical protein QVD17_32970 [Tagetes erecta]|uniref:DUF4283 domain-containing protein n=1 Tax=Tagetes erecta TaxID=13708 RepID=A0AAD8K2P2_TARER|nr:hypothetical protein QVD17_32970 [Tagetes erecta]